MAARTSGHSARASWWSRSSLASKLFIVTSVATVLVMATIAVIMGWQSLQTARQAVYREIATSLEGVDRSLQLAYTTARDRAGQLIPVLERELGGRPYLDGSADDSGVPLLIVDDTIINGDIGHLLRMNENTGADPAVIVKAPQGWVRVATLLRDAQGEVRLNSVVEPDDLLARTLDSGEPYGGLVQRNGRWYAMSIMPLADEAGVVYGGLSVRVDVHQQVADVIQLVTQSQVAEYGSLGLLTRSPSGRLQVVAAGEGALFGLQQGAAEDLLNMHLDESSGFVEITPPDGDSHLVVWQSIDNWGWVLYGAGEESLFMAANLRVIIMQMVMMLVGTLLISLLVGSLAARTLRPVRDIDRKSVV